VAARGARAAAGATRRVGVLISGAENDRENQALVGALRQGLERLGWSEGRNLRLDTRFAGTAEQFQPLAQEIVALRPDVVLVQTTPFTAAVQHETRTIPVVFTGVSDPIGSGFIANLARPGGNITGFLLYEDGIVGKWLAMLKEIAPALTRAALIASPRNMPYDYFLRSAQAAAPGLGIELVPSRIESIADIELAIQSLARAPNSGLVFLPDAIARTNRDIVVALAARYRLPAVYSTRLFVSAGGLMSYSTDLADMFRRAARYVDRVLKGENPADLPVQAPTKFETMLNLRTAKALGFAVPPGLLVAADEVIE
jgi:putative ABC transport system substrate-binding protein